MTIPVLLRSFLSSKALVSSSALATAPKQSRMNARRRGPRGGVQGVEPEGVTSQGKLRGKNESSKFVHV